MLWLTLLACQEPWYTFLPPGHEPAAQADCEDVGDFQSVGQPFFLTWCSSCHSDSMDTTTWGAPEQVALDTLEGIRSHAERSAARVAEGTMPPAGGPSAAEVEAVVAWLDCGAPGTANPLPEGDAASDWTVAEGNSEASYDPDFPEGLSIRVDAGDAVLVERWLVDEDEAWLVRRELEVEGEAWLQEFGPPLQLAGAEAFSQELEQRIEGPEGSLVLDQTWTVEPTDTIEPRTATVAWQLATSDDGERIELGFTGGPGFGWASLEHAGLPELVLWSSTDAGPDPAPLLSDDGGLVMVVLWR